VTGRPAGGAPRLEVLRAEDRHAAEIADFIRQIWDPRATAEAVVAARQQEAARNVAEPGVAPPTWIALQAGRVLGYVTTIPIRLWAGERDWPAYWIKGLMVLPECRGGPVGYLVLKAAVASLPRTGALAVAPPALRLFAALGYTDLGPVPNWIRPIAPHRILRRLDTASLGLSQLPRWAPRAVRLAQTTGLGAVAGWAGGVALRAAAGALRLPGTGLAAGPFEPAASVEELEPLWLAARRGFPTGVVRDARYLVHRYGAGKDGPYLWQSVRDRDTLAGVAILRRPRTEGDERLKGIRVAALADILYPTDRPAVGLALLGAVERAARAVAADAILASCSAPGLQSALRRQCYLPLSGNVHLLLRDITGERTGLGTALSDWWLTRGDGLADEVF
jgi:hypothetical protein